MNPTEIGWSQMTHNSTTGCDKLSPGCKHCYASKMAKRLKAMGNPRYRNEFKLTLHPDKIDEPRTIKTGKMIFVNSMSDLFHKDVPLEFIQRYFKMMNETPQHTYQILTKRSERLAEISSELEWSDNVWMGVSIENDDYLYRMDHLKLCGAKTKFISAEPLLGPLYNMDLNGIDWVIVGGESGFKARPIQKDWVEDIQVQCLTQDVPFFFKQWGGKNKKKAGNLLNGQTFEAFPNGITSIK